MKEASKLAAVIGEDPEKAAIAGLLHDSATGLDYATQLKILTDNNDDPGIEGRSCPWVLHGPAGKYLVTKEFGIADEDILNAICYHTYGREDLTRLDKIVMIADFTDPTRTIPEIADTQAEVRKMALVDLDKAVLITIDSTLSFLIEKGMQIHPNSVIARNALLRHMITPVGGEARIDKQAPVL
jgi:predicted HD superfamily hydrolase involved in NAD metabolism